MTVAAYVRVSSRSQHRATQIHAIRSAAEARGDKLQSIYSEKRSGKKLDRPELARVRELARRGELHKLYVFRLDRLTRSGIRDTLVVLDELRAAGCKVVSVADGFDLDGAAADVVIAVMAWAASMERVALGERIAAARKRVEAAGGRWGRPTRVPALLATRIRMAREAGDSIRELAARFKVPRSTVAAVLSEKGPYSAVTGAAKKPTKKGTRAR